MTRRFMRWQSIGVLLLMLGPACTFGADEPGGSGGSVAADEPVTLRVWTHQNKSFNTGLKDLAAEYQAANPNVTLKFETFDYDSYIQTLQTALPAGTEADILQMFGTWTCSYADNLAPVPAEISSLADAQSAFFEAPIGGYTCDDTLYGFPQEFNIEYGATLVNTAIADAAGVDTSAGWASWDQFMADAKTLTETRDGVITRTGYHFTSADALVYSFLSLILQGGGQFVADDGASFTIDTPEAREAVALMRSMVDEGIIDPELFNDTANWVGDCYFEEACSMGLVGPWVVPEYSADFPEVAAATRYVALPTLGETPDFVADSGWGLTVSSNSPAANVAWDFVSFVALDEENAAAWNTATGTLPALQANGEGATQEQLIADYPHFEAWFPLLQYGQYVGNLPDRDLLWYEIAYPHLLGVLQGTENVDDALVAMESEANDTFR
jgi:multiple sugar transport system substrate-binding protein